jgi:predicted ATPase
VKIESIFIDNYKSLRDFRLKDCKPFCAFVGPNASGKSNIFEAMEFANYVCKYSFEAPRFFGGKDNILTFRNDAEINQPNALQKFEFQFDDGIPIEFTLNYSLYDDYPAAISMFSKNEDNDENVEFLDPTDIRDITKRTQFLQLWKGANRYYGGEFEQFVDSFSRIFIGNENLVRISGSTGFASELIVDGRNLAQILGKIFANDGKREEFLEWLPILIPEFKNLEVRASHFRNEFEFFVYETGSSKPFPSSLISDGTFNILALMSAVFQADQPQFLCIEEPENGLHPQAIEKLVDFFREKCESNKHHIWLNTHSRSLVACLEIEEIILVNKINGRTRAKQMNAADSIDVKTDEAWLTNALGGGLTWSK